MTNKEMEKTIQFILDQQARAEVRQAQFETETKKQTEFILQEQAKTESNFQSLMEIVREMARGIATLTINAENDRQEIRTAISSVSSSVSKLSNVVSSMNNRIIKLEDEKSPE